MPMPVRVLELRSVRGTGGGPEKTILLGAAKADPSRYAVTVCYIRDLRDDIFHIDRRAAQLGVDYVEVHERHSFDFAIWGELRRLVRDRQIDIVHAHDYKTNLYAWLLAWAEHIQPLTTLHGYTGNSSRERVYYALDKRLVRRFPLLVTVSGDLRDELIRTGCRPDRIVRILNGIDHEMFRRDRSREAAARASLGLDSRDFVIGAVGRLEQQKRFDLLMDAFATLRQSRGSRRLRLVIVGDGSLRGALERQRAELSLESDCVLAGQQSDVPFLHHAFDLFVQSSDYEGTSNAVLEAMALETPLVATDVGGTAELVRPDIDGIIIPPGQREALVAAIQRVLTDPDATRARAASARARVEGELSFATRMATLEALYDRLVPSASGTPRDAMMERA